MGKRLSEGHRKVVRGDLFNRFSLMTNFLPVFSVGCSAYLAAGISNNTCQGS